MMLLVDIVSAFVYIIDIIVIIITIIIWLKKN